MASTPEHSLSLERIEELRSKYGDALTELPTAPADVGLPSQKDTIAVSHLERSTAPTRGEGDQQCFLSAPATIRPLTDQSRQSSPVLVDRRPKLAPSAGLQPKQALSSKELGLRTGKTAPPLRRATTTDLWQLVADLTTAKIAAEAAAAREAGEVATDFSRSHPAHDAPRAAQEPAAILAPPPTVASDAGTLPSATTVPATVDQEKDALPKDDRSSAEPQAGLERPYPLCSQMSGSAASIHTTTLASPTIISHSPLESAHPAPLRCAASDASLTLSSAQSSALSSSKFGFSNAPSPSGQPARLQSFKEKHGWGQPGHLAAMIHRLSNMKDLPPEDETEAEHKQVAQLKSMVLKRLGLTEPPAIGTWRSQHFTQTRLLGYLRSRNNNLNKAVERAVACIRFLDSVIEKARAYEESPAQQRQLADTLNYSGMYGLDKRGASVAYMHFMKNDSPELVKRTSFDFYISFDWYYCLFYWDTLYVESLNAGCALSGRTLVVDVSGITITKIKRTLELATKQMAGWPEKEHPYPEGLKQTLVCNVPWIAEKFWNSSKMFFPARDVAKVKLFKASDPDFVKELQKHVQLDQVPVAFGGASDEPWCYGRDALQTPSERAELSMQKFAQRVSNRRNSLRLSIQARQSA